MLRKSQAWRWRFYKVAAAQQEIGGAGALVAALPDRFRQAW
jgi:hypothetical protein